MHKAGCNMLLFRGLCAVRGWFAECSHAWQDNATHCKERFIQYGFDVDWNRFMGLFGCIVSFRNLLPPQTISASLSAIAPPVT